MNEMFKDVTGIAMAIIGVAILYTLVSKNNNTTGVIGAATSGFANLLSVATGQGTGASMNVLSF